MILVVDNDPTVLDQAQQILNRERQVFLALDATRALELSGNLGFSVALVDLDLPGGAWVDLIRTLRRNVPTKRLPLLFLRRPLRQLSQLRRLSPLRRKNLPLPRIHRPGSRRSLRRPPLLRPSTSLPVLLP